MRHGFCTLGMNIPATGKITRMQRLACCALAHPSGLTGWLAKILNVSCGKMLRAQRDKYMKLCCTHPVHVVQMRGDHE
tara:strand:- start:266 stop:499 length:234 start_codon:yes stop_codon:yes gene_type:complete